MFKNVETKPKNIKTKAKNIFNKKNLLKVKPQSSISKIKSSAYAILIGFILGGVVILSMGGNPFAAFKTMFDAPFTERQFNETMADIAIFALMGAGIGISFKTGLFNIGASGQFMAAGATTVYIGIYLNTTAWLSLPLLMLIAILIGGAVAGFAGLLKALFNVHEVVGTIMINWIVFYIVKYIFQNDGTNNKLYGGPSGSKKVLDNNRFDLSRSSNQYMMIVAITLIVLIGIFILFKYTTFGYRLRVNGLSSTAAEYSGIDTRVNTVLSMFLSGSLAGLAGFFYYNSIQKNIPNLDKDLPTYGFEAITVTLLAFSSPLGAIPAAALYSAMASGASSAGIVGGVSEDTIRLTLAIVIFIAALADRFTSFSIIHLIYRRIWTRKYDGHSKHFAKYEKALNDENKFFDKLILKESKLNKEELILFKEIKNSIDIELKSINSKTKDILELKNNIKKLELIINNSIKTFEENKIFRYESKMFVRKMYIKFSSMKTNIIELSYKEESIDELEKGALIRKLSAQNHKFMTTHGINAYKETLKNHKIILSGAKKSYISSIHGDFYNYLEEKGGK